MGFDERDWDPGKRERWVGTEDKLRGVATIQRSSPDRSNWQPAMRNL